MAGRPIHIVDICTGFSFVIVLNYFCTPSGVSVHSTGIDDEACTNMKEKCERSTIYLFSCIDICASFLPKRLLWLFTITNVIMLA